MNRRMGDRRHTDRRKSSQTFDGIAAPWPFPVTSSEVLCGVCGQRFPGQIIGGNAIGIHKCPGRA